MQLPFSHRPLMPSSFYTNNKLPLGLLAKKEDPEYAVDPDKAPETFSEPYGGRSSEGGGIVSILGYIKEDLENEIGTSKKAEAAAQKEFEEQRAAATQVLNAMKAMKENKQKYRESLKPKCDWMKGAFDTRRSKRREEMDGLLQAKAALAGAAAGEEEALVQKTSFLKKHAA